MGFRIDFSEEESIEPNKSYMFCPNHASLLDPFLLIAISKNPIVFVGKKELAKIPVFGFLYKRTVIMVDRSSLESRKRVFEMAKKRLQNGVSMAIFPEGLVPTEDVVLSPFKKGAFSLAIEFEIPIVPQVYYDCKRFFSWDVFKGRPGVLRVQQYNFIETKGMSVAQDLDILKDKTFNLLYNDLEKDSKYMKDTTRTK
ncbi:lysophospholipid acyltransferase family protein [Polaribacter sp. PL03]|uniref:lysophospholipid acyltransferase family protein n=1 Tax=Polaribacter sp. PL03 TaxID=3088353 RepID=UPI0029D1A6EF|nr:lysophospholipid acyltransferase family protein [Polaribacter sp. PL03]MDX6745286.1 lysophospholipid acyltransferase family protein [Polaribacter sp. PL03]